MNSIWCDIPDYPNYKVSPEGNFLSLNYNKTGKTKILKFGNSNGYKNIRLSGIDKVGKWFTVHRIVAKVFCEKEIGSNCVNHKDGNKLNNHFSNLEWCTNADNQLHSYNVLGNKAARGSMHGISKLNEEQVIKIFSMINKNISYTIISKKYNISKATITNIKKGLVWSHITGGHNVT